MAKLIKNRSQRTKKKEEVAFRITRLGKGYWAIKYRGSISNKKIHREVRNGKSFSFIKIGGKEVQVLV